MLVRGVDQHGFRRLVPLERHVTVTAPRREPRPGGQLHLQLRPERLHVRRSHLDRRDAADADLLVELRQRLGHRPGPEADLHHGGTYTVTLTVRDERDLSGAPLSQTVTDRRAAGQRGADPGASTPRRAPLVCNFSSGGSADPNIGDTFTYWWEFGKRPRPRVPR